jgi:hypothetical protein
MRIARDRRPWLIGLATAASLLAVLLAYDRLRPRPPDGAVAAQGGWGWSRPDALPRAVPPAAYLNRLADEAAEWFGVRPEEPIALARRLAEFRQGCSVLILAEHRPLSPEDRRWLVAKCRDWASKLDRHLAAVEAGEDSLKVRTEVDDTVNKMIATLLERAKSLS